MSADAAMAVISANPPSGKSGKTQVYLHNRLLCRDRERETHAHVREQRFVTSLLETLVSPTSGGTESCRGVTPSALQGRRSIGLKEAITSEERGSSLPREPRTQLSVVSAENQSTNPRSEEDGCCVPCLVKCRSRKFANASRGSRPLDLVH